jgi:hypothetical protein
MHFSLENITFKGLMIIFLIAAVSTGSEHAWKEVWSLFKAKDYSQPIDYRQPIAPKQKQVGTASYSDYPTSLLDSGHSEITPWSPGASDIKPTQPSKKRNKSSVPLSWDTVDTSWDTASPRS